MSTIETATDRKVFTNLEAAILEWGGHTGHAANRLAAMDLVHAAASHAGTSFDHAYLTPSNAQVNVVFADSPQVAMIIHVGFVQHRDPDLPGSFTFGNLRWLNTLLPYHTHQDAARRPSNLAKFRGCSCSPGLRQPVNATECSQCGEAF